MGSYIQQGIDLLKNVVMTNWGLVAGAVLGIFVLKVIKTSFNIVLGIIFAGIAIAILTNIGIMPPLNEILEGVRNLVL